MFPSGLILVTLSEDSVCDDQIVFCTLAEEEDTTGVSFPHPMFPDGVTPDFRVTPNPCIEVTQENELVCGCQDCIKGTIEMLFIVLLIVKCGGIGTDDGSILVVAELKLEAHKAFTDANGPFRQLVSDLVFDGKTDTMDTPLT